MGEGARRDQGRAETMTATDDEAICAELAGRLKAAIVAYLTELPELDRQSAVVGCAVPSVLTTLTVEYVAMFGEIGVPVRAACVTMIDAAIDGNHDEIADLVRARRGMN